MPHDDGVEDRFLVEGELVLPEDRHAFPWSHEDFALVRLDFAGQDFQEGRFSGAVGPDQAVAVAGGELDVDVFEEDPLAVGESDIGCRNHEYWYSFQTNKK